jgi:hypothetical protein
LRSTSRFLEGTAERIEASDQLNPLLLKVTTGVTIAVERSLPTWRKLLNLIRDRLPTDLNRKLGDRTLSGILAGSIVVLFWFTSSLFSPKPPQSTQVATRPPVTIPVQPTQFPPDLTAPDAAPEVVSAPIEVIEPIAEPIAEVPPELVEPEIEPVIETPQPEPVQSEATVEAIQEAEAPPPEPELTPEQKQIAAIQSQVMEISDRFIGGLVTSVEPQIDRDRLKVRVSEDWYRFSADQQDRFANELWARSQSIDLPKLQITDSQGSLLARPPIVGESMVILKRKTTLT